MSAVSIVTDSTADLGSVQAAELGITVVPLVVQFGDRSYRDGVDLSPTEFFQMLRQSPTLPTTSQPSAAAFEAAYRPLVDAGQSVVSVHLAGSLSGTLASAQTAARGFPEGRVVVIDSYSITLGLGWIVETAARAARAGGDVAAVVAAIQPAIAGAQVYAMPDTLEYLQRGGRIGRLQSLVGSMLSIKPIVRFRAGELHPVDRVRTRSRAIQRLAEICARERPLARVAVLHAQAPDAAAQLACLVARDLPTLQIVTREIGPVIGTHVGPGAVGAAFIGEPFA